MVSVFAANIILIIALGVIAISVFDGIITDTIENIQRWNNG